MPTETLANGEVWELRLADWHMTSPAEDYAPVSDEHFLAYSAAIAAGAHRQSYLELYRVALGQIAGVTPWSATEDERKRARAMVESYYTGGLDRERIIRDQQASYARSISPNRPGPFGTQIIPEDG